MCRLCVLLLKMASGFLFCALSAVTAINANWGLSPWDVMHQGLAYNLNITMGQASILLSFLLIVIAHRLGLEIGIGTFANMLIVGIFIDILNTLDFIPKSTGCFLSLLLLMGSIICNAIGCYWYISCSMGCGPRDGLMIVVSQCLRFPVGSVRFVIEASATALGWFLGGSFGIGTVFIVLSMGVCMQFVFRWFKCDVTHLDHRNLKQGFAFIRHTLKRPLHHGS